MISRASRAALGVWSSLAACGVLCLACHADATVYRSASGAGAAGAAAVYGCGAKDRGSDAILADILERLRQDLLVPDGSCASDADCSQTFTTPTCNRATARCETCADPLQQTQFGVRLGACLGVAAQSCCRNPDAAPDCLVRACAIACGGQ